MATGTINLFAANPAPVWNPYMLWIYLLLGAAVLAGAVVIAFVRRWYLRSRADRLSASDQLAEFRSLYEQGTISQEEFERLRSLLGKELRQSFRLPSKSALRPHAADALKPRENPPESPSDGIQPASPDGIQPL